MSNSKSNVVSIPGVNGEQSADRNVSSVPVRVLPRTKKKLESLLARINKGRSGRKVKSSDLVDFAIELLTDNHLAEISERTLSNKDRFELAYRNAQKGKKKLSRDEFLGILLNDRSGI